MTTEEILSALSPSVAALPRFRTLAETVCRQAADLADCVESLPAAFSLESAAGVTLDWAAGILGISRPGGLGDGDFRLLIRRKLALWRWDGTMRGAREILEEYYPGTSMENVPGEIAVRVTGLPALPVPKEELLPVPAGVEIVSV